MKEFSLDLPPEGDRRLEIVELTRDRWLVSATRFFADDDGNTGLPESMASGSSEVGVSGIQVTTILISKGIEQAHEIIRWWRF